MNEIVNSVLNNRVRHYKGFWITKFSGEVVFVLKKNQDLKIMSYNEVLFNSANYCIIESTINEGLLYGSALHNINSLEKNGNIYYHVIDILPIERFNNIKITS